MANTRFINETGVKPEIDTTAVIDGTIDCIHKVTIKENVFSGHDVMILTGGHDPEKFGEERKASNGGGPVTIEEDVWIASRAMIIGPSHIGKHAVIGAGSVIRGNVPPYALMIGNPAKIAKFLVAKDNQ